eukprot:2534006-Rhodomonas_salina.2
MGMLCYQGPCPPRTPPPPNRRNTPPTPRSPPTRSPSGANRRIASRRIASRRIASRRVLWRALGSYTQCPVLREYRPRCPVLTWRMWCTLLGTDNVDGGCMPLRVPFAMSGTDVVAASANANRRIPNRRIPNRRIPNRRIRTPTRPPTPNRCYSTLP